MVGLLKLRSATLLVATIVVAGAALGLSADGSVAAAKRPAGAVKLTGASQKSVGAVRCGKLSGSWLPGTKLAGDYFITHTQQAANFKKLASRSKGKTRAKYLRSAAKFKSKARSQLARCRAPTPKPATAPGAPTGVTGVAGDASVVVSWLAPSSDGGSAVTGYTVTASGGGSHTCTTSGALSCTVTGLTNGTAYTFTAVATNAVGDSAASAASASLTPALGPYAVGKTGPGGGKVFYAPAAPFTVTGAACATACRYLEVAPAGWYPGGPTDPELRWGGFGVDGRSCSEKNIPGTAIGIGSGAANTAAILAACPDRIGPNSAPAAYAASDYAPTVNGGIVRGWFLPSLDELNRLDISGVGDLEYGADFWSSSQGRPEFNAWYQKVGQHIPNPIYKSADNTFVRPVRAFG